MRSLKKSRREASFIFLGSVESNPVASVDTPYYLRSIILIIYLNIWIIQIAPISSFPSSTFGLYEDWALLNRLPLNR